MAIVFASLCFDFVCNWEQKLSKSKFILKATILKETLLKK